jgi:hypothetical protein
MGDSIAEISSQLQKQHKGYTISGGGGAVNVEQLRN